MRTWQEFYALSEAEQNASRDYWGKVVFKDAPRGCHPAFWPLVWHFATVDEVRATADREILRLHQVGPKTLRAIRQITGPFLDRRQRLIDRLRALDDRSKPALDFFDQEQAHIDADNLLLDYIDDDDIRAAYEDIPKWYA